MAEEKQELYTCPQCNTALDFKADPTEWSCPACNMVYMDEDDLREMLRLPKKDKK